MKEVKVWMKGMSFDKVCEWEEWGRKLIETLKDDEKLSFGIDLGMVKEKGVDGLCEIWVKGGKGMNMNRLIKVLREMSENK